MVDLYQILAEHHIEYERHDHPPVYTVEDVKRLVPPLPAAKTKNLFLRDQKGKRHFLVIVPADKRLNIKALNDRIGSSRLSFGSADRLKKYLGVDPGSVTIFALINDPDHFVELIIDMEGFQFRLLMRFMRLVISVMRMPYFLFCKTTSPLAINLSFASMSTGSPSCLERLTVEPGSSSSNS